MTRVTLSQKKAALTSEKADIERLIERRHATPAHLSRLSEIEEQFRVFGIMEKPKKESGGSNMSEKRIGICVYCNETVLENEESILTNAMLHKDCENDVMAEIQDQQRWN